MAISITQFGMTLMDWAPHYYLDNDFLPTHRIKNGAVQSPKGFSHNLISELTLYQVASLLLASSGARAKKNDR